MADLEDGTLLRDEKGSRSAMRVLLFAVAMPMLCGMTIAEAARVHEFQNSVWTVWSSITGYLIVGCFGPRIAQHLAPSLGAAAAAIASSLRDPRLPSRFDRHKED